MSQHSRAKSYKKTDPKWGMLDPPEAWYGKVTLMIHDQDCPRCKGKGKRWMELETGDLAEVKCRKCDGAGRVMAKGERFIPNDEVEDKKKRGWRVVDTVDPTKPVTKVKEKKESAIA